MDGPVYGDGQKQRSEAADGHKLWVKRKEESRASFSDLPFTCLINEFIWKCALYLYHISFVDIPRHLLNEFTLFEILINIDLIKSWIWLDECCILSHIFTLILMFSIEFTKFNLLIFISRNNWPIPIFIQQNNGGLNFLNNSTKL
jgi:hypothetical protein